MIKSYFTNSYSKLLTSILCAIHYFFKVKRGLLACGRNRVTQCGTELESPQTSSLWSFCSHFWAIRDIFDVPISLAFSCRADLARILLSWFSPKDWKFYRNLKEPVAFHTNKLVLWNIAYSFIYTLKDIILFGIDRKLSKIPITTRTTTPAPMQAIGYWFTHAG